MTTTTTVSANGRRRLPITVNRNAPEPNLQPLTDYFKGFEKVGAVRAVFGDQTEEVLGRLKIMFISNRRMYMGIRDEDGNIAIGTWHLKNSELRVLYLDIVHELFHIKQHMDDSKYFHREHMKFMRDRSLYYSSPIEVPAYRHTVREAERIGMQHDELVEYLNMGPVPPEIFATFLERMELKKDGASSASPPAKSGRTATLPVRINRKPALKLFPFTDYFKGFEKVEAVRALFGDQTEKVLQKLKVEFTDSPFRSIFPSDEDGHLVADSTYVRKGAVGSIYLDVLLSLNVLKRFSAQKGQAGFGDQGLESPVILESYRAVVEEARRMGVPDAKLMPHLQLPRFMMSTEAYAAFLSELGVAAGTA